MKLRVKCCDLKQNGTVEDNVKEISRRTKRRRKRRNRQQQPVN